jgi:hypothetical protein
MIVHSLEQALYQVTVMVDGSEALLTENDGSLFRRHSLNAVREALSGLRISRLRLRHTSAYDEMIGQPLRDNSNALEVSLSIDAWAPLMPDGKDGSQQ